MFKRFFFILSATIFFIKVSAQNALPDFSVDDLGKGQVRISWTNQYGTGCIQMNIQRSYDSVKNFRSILAVQSPELPQNGYVDASQTGSFMYYRIFYVLTGGAYYFTKSKHATLLQVDSALNKNIITDQDITVMLRDSLYAELTPVNFKKFRDSIFLKTKDTLFTLNANEVMLKPFVPTGNWMPSQYIYTDRNGFVTINLPDAKKNNYVIHFFDSNNKEIFTIKHLDYTQLILDKENFIHSGWFTFDIYENDKLKEKNKFFLQKDL